MPYCSKCSKEVKDDDILCATCGTSLKESSVNSRSYNSERWEERVDAWSNYIEINVSTWQEERFWGSLMGGLIILWLGVTLLLSEYGYLTGGWWGWFLSGIGFIFLGRGLYSLFRNHRGRGKGFVYSGVIIGVMGATSIVGIVNWWAILFVVMGLIIILSAFNRQL
jgi:hypothetical protein